MGIVWVIFADKHTTSLVDLRNIILILCCTTLFHKARHYGTYSCTDIKSTLGFELMDAGIFTCLPGMFEIPVSCSLLCICDCLSSHLWLAPPPHAVASRWPSHNEIRGEKTRHDIKASWSGSHMGGAGAGRLLRFVLGQFDPFPPLISRGLVSELHQPRHLPAISHAMSCTCRDPCPDASRRHGTRRPLSHLTVSY